MKDELKELLKEHLKIKLIKKREIIAGVVFNKDTATTKVELYFDDELISTDKYVEYH